MMAQPKQHPPPRSAERAMSELRALVEQGQLIQIIHDLSVEVLGAKCRCGERHDEHEADPADPETKGRP